MGLGEGVDFRFGPRVVVLDSGNVDEGDVNAEYERRQAAIALDNANRPRSRQGHTARMRLRMGR